MKQKIKITLHDAKEFLLDLLFPVSCIGCNTPDTLLCSQCNTTIIPAEWGCIICSSRNDTGKPCQSCKKEVPHLERAFWGTSYSNELMRDMIKACKYRGEKSFVPLMCMRIIPSLEKALQERKGNSAGEIVFIPIPLHKYREQERGFNQAEVIARELAGHFLFPLTTNVLKRVRATPPQALIHEKNARKKNMENAFEIRNWEQVTGKTVILVDDVVTTGSTVEEAARLLKLKGARRVWAAAVARG